MAPYGPLADGIGPGEVVWAHVPFEEDHSQGKDRPTLVVGHDSGWVLGLPMTSQDHDRDEDQERRAGRHWIDVGSGAWDRQRRRSEGWAAHSYRKRFGVWPNQLAKTPTEPTPEVLGYVRHLDIAFAKSRGKA